MKARQLVEIAEHNMSVFESILKASATIDDLIDDDDEEYQDEIMCYHCVWTNKATKDIEEFFSHPKIPAKKKLFVKAKCAKLGKRLLKLKNSDLRIFHFSPFQLNQWTKLGNIEIINSTSMQYMSQASVTEKPVDVTPQVNSPTKVDELVVFSPKPTMQPMVHIIVTEKRVETTQLGSLTADDESFSPETYQQPVCTTSPLTKPSCNQREVEMVNNTVLATHVKEVHEEVRYPCNYCDKIFFITSKLRSHVNTAHEGVRYPWNNCDQNFFEIVKLKSHAVSNHQMASRQCNQS